MRDFGPNARTGSPPTPVAPARAMPARRRHRHRVDKSLPGRHSRPADVEQECRHLPTRSARRHFHRQMPAARSRGAGGRHVRSAGRHVAAALVPELPYHRERRQRPATFLPSCPDLFRASTSCGIVVQARRGRGDGETWMPGTSPGMTKEETRARPGTATGDAGVPKSEPRPARSAGNPPLPTPCTRSTEVKPDSNGLVPGMTKWKQTGRRAGDRDRGGPHGSTPPTPPCIRVRTPRFGGFELRPGSRGRRDRATRRRHWAARMRARGRCRSAYFD